MNLLKKLIKLFLGGYKIKVKINGKELKWVNK